MDDDDDGFNVFAADDFLGVACEDLGQSVLQIVSAGVGSRTLDNGTVEITKTLNDAVQKAFADSDQLLVASNLAAQPTEPSLFDRNIFTEDDYARVCSGQEFLFPMLDENENIPTPTSSTRQYAKITDFPLEPGGMSFEFCHEWVMICAGRNKILEKELQERLQREYDNLVFEHHYAKEKGIGQSDIVEITRSLLNGKMETYAKLGMLREVKALTEEYGEKLDFCQRDRCGVTLMGRMCIWPCAAKYHSHCQIIEFLATHCTDQWNDVNQKTLGRHTTALMIAARVGDPCKLKALLKCGAYVNDVDLDGRTALTLAAERGRENIVATLLAYGANTSPTTAGSPSALALAYENCYPNVKMLISKHCKNVSIAIQRLCDNVIGEFISIKFATTPLFCINLREVQQTFTSEFSSEYGQFTSTGLMNLLVITCIQRDSKGKFRCRKNSYLKTVRLNGMREESIMEDRNAVDIVTMRSLRPLEPNWLEITFDFTPKNSQMKVLIQGFACDLSSIPSALESPPPPAIEAKTPVPVSILKRRPIPTNEQDSVPNGMETSASSGENTAPVDTENDGVDNMDCE